MYCSLTRRLIEVAVVFAAFAFTISAFAQIQLSVLSGTCTGEDGKPLAGYTIQLDQTEMNRTVRTKTNKKGEYRYMGLETGNYRMTLFNPDGAQVVSISRHIPMGDNVTVDFNMAKGSAASMKEQMDNSTGSSGYYYNQGVGMVNQGKLDEAAVSLKKATDLDPKNAGAFYWYGMALLGKAETKADGTVVPVPGTVEAFQNYLKLQPHGEWAQAARASLDQLKATVKATKKKKS
jgi:tetratricopeptide (TPR) repeat protein